MESVILQALAEVSILGLAFALPAHATTRPKNLLAQPTRRYLSEFVAQWPGATASELCRVGGLKWGTVQHHLYLLERAGLLVGASAGRDRGFFSAEMPEPLRRQILAIRTGRASDLARRVLANPGLGQTELASGIGMSRKVLRRCVEGLRSEGLVEERRAGHRCTYYPTKELEGVSVWLKPVCPAVDVANIAARAVGTAMVATPDRLPEGLAVPMIRTPS